ncbi:MAG: DUF3850 domain-containing protein [Promicromonosporaceae bacterium]|nr:DUF3850 domain-containing protein [Promicromonosporaceae bacterium]
MTTHVLKIERRWWDAIRDGSKTFEVRRNDRNYQRGDRVQFQLILTGPVVMGAPIEFEIYEITYVLPSGAIPGIEHGYCVFGIKEIEQ